MTKLFIVFIFSLISESILAQGETINNNPINSCSGAINIFETGTYQLQFTGTTSDNLISEYASLSQIGTENQIWCSYIAPSTGELTFTASKNDGYLQMVIFKEVGKDICGEIANGSAEIERLIDSKSSNEVGLSYNSETNKLYTLDLNEGQKIQVLFSTNEKREDRLDLVWKFKTEIERKPVTKIVDMRNDDFAPTFSILIRDKESKEPLVANLSIEGSKTIDALYSGSDIFLNLKRNCEISIKCDVEGYFFQDILHKAVSFEDMELLIEMERISKGKSIKIEEIEFKPGTSEIVESSVPKLNRLKDFLALNSDVNIEIQGHVFALGDNSFAAQRISEARAKRVMKFLVENGISKDRLTSVGYGNTKPLFEKPKFFYEEQANRRVEILIK